MLKIARNRYDPFKNVAQLLRNPAVIAIFVEIVEYLIFNPTGRTGVNTLGVFIKNGVGGVRKYGDGSVFFTHLRWGQ